MDIQKLHDWAKVEKEKAYSKVKNPEYAINGMRSEAIKEFDAFSLILNGAELLLLHEPEASAETALSQTLMLGDVPTSLAEDQAIKEVAGGLGETPAVRQNEQTQTVLPHQLVLIKGKKDWFCWFCKKYEHELIGKTGGCASRAGL